jgi:hypothetical protein
VESNGCQHTCNMSFRPSQGQAHVKVWSGQRQGHDVVLIQVLLHHRSVQSNQSYSAIPSATIFLPLSTTYSRCCLPKLLFPIPLHTGSCCPWPPPFTGTCGSSRSSAPSSTPPTTSCQWSVVRGGPAQLYPEGFLAVAAGCGMCFL